MLTKLKNFVITSKEKAVVAFLITTISTYMVQNGLTYKDLLTRSALWALVCGVAAHLLVYFTTNTTAQ